MRTKRKKTLLDVALSTKVARGANVTMDEQLEDVAFAWLQGKIGLMQVQAAAKAAGRTASEGNIYNTIVMALRQAYRKGRIRLLP